MTQPTYDDKFKAEAVELAQQIGAYQAAKRLGVGYNTLRRWVDPAFRESEYAAQRTRKRVPCENFEVCGNMTNVYSRKHPQYGMLCRSCLATAMADAERGFTPESMRKMHWEENMSTSEIAAVTGQSQSAVHALMSRHGIPIRSRAEGIALRPGGMPEHGKVDIEELKRLEKQGLSIPKIAAELAVSPSTVQYHLDKLGLRK